MEIYQQNDIKIKGIITLHFLELQGNDSTSNLKGKKHYIPLRFKGDNSLLPLVDISNRIL